MIAATLNRAPADCPGTVPGAAPAPRTWSAQLLSEGAEAEEDGDLQCLCVKTTSQVRPRHITSLEVIKAGPHCPTAQLIATLKNGRKICLDLQAPLYKKIVKKLLES
ncbi:platelet factor 4 isoform X1 [Piliocolobus tephrosceles]|uniref:platelet factor 4 isoform X1 n=1 Tax=Piliocolobus tephrosceles TaxID=591936 RepID=UPI000C297556|nr:platelet factor 4 isoform X1 [Piliocolobus tephrosceles]